MIRSYSSWISNTLDSGLAFAVSAFISVIGYFSPIGNILLLLLILFGVDVSLGIWASKKLRKEPFSMKKIFRTAVPRFIISAVIILITYAWDNVYSQDLVCTYKVAGWFISGLLIISITKNGYQITNWSVFKSIERLIKKQIDKRIEEEALNKEENLVNEG